MIGDTQHMQAFVSKKMRGFRIPSRHVPRMKTLLIVAPFIFVTHFIVKDGISMIKVKFKHPRQFLVRILALPSFVEEQPDLHDDGPGMYDKQLKEDFKALCPKKPQILSKFRPVDENVTDLHHVTRTFTPYKPGGHFKPQECISHTKAAIIIPYRNREHHLVVLLNNLIPFLVRQQTEFAIFVVEPVANVPFNRALLMNVGFKEALKTNDFNCFFFHDVDLLPESDFNLYRCGNTPRHMAVATSGHNYTLPYYSYIGGVVSMTRDIYEKINGHSNLYFGWGGEDDDLLYRLIWKGYKISRYPQNIARYKSVFHKRDVGNEDSDSRFQLLWTSEKRIEKDGLNSLKYTIKNIEIVKLYTKILVDVNMDDYNRAILDFT